MKQDELQTKLDGIVNKLVGYEDRFFDKLSSKLADFRDDITRVVHDQVKSMQSHFDGTIQTLSKRIDEQSGRIDDIEVTVEEVKNKVERLECIKNPKILKAECKDISVNSSIEKLVKRRFFISMIVLALCMVALGVLIVYK